MITATEMTIAARMHSMSYGQFCTALKCGAVTMPPMEEIRKRIVKPKRQTGGTKGSRPVCQYDLQGEFVCSYETAYAAAAAMGREKHYSITAACDGRYLQAYGFQWRYMDEEAPGPLERKKGRASSKAHWVEQPCKNCGKIYKGPKNSRYCSDECKRKVQQEQNKTNYLQYRALWQPSERVCPYCGIKFMPKDCHQKYCCAEHRKAEEWQRRKKAQNRK